MRCVRADLRCDVNHGCKANSDCFSGLSCDDGVCSPCGNGIKDFDEQVMLLGITYVAYTVCNE